MAPRRTTAAAAARNVTARIATSPIRSLRRRLDARSEYSERATLIGTATLNGRSHGSSSGSPACNHPFTLRLPTPLSTAGMLASVDSKTRQEGEEGLELENHHAAGGRACGACG